mgnify:CR=1 FL=1
MCGVTERLQQIPWPLRLAVAVVALEATVMLVLAGLELFSLDTSRLVMGLTTAAFFAGYGAFLLLCAKGLVDRSSWARSPIVLAQLIQLGVAWSYWGSTPTYSLALAAVALVVLAGIFHPASLEALSDAP